MRDLRVCKESELLMCCGREFRRVEAMAAKARSLKVRGLVQVMGVRRLESAAGRMVVEKLSDIRRGRVIESFVGEEEEFVLDAILHLAVVPLDLIEGFNAKALVPPLASSWIETLSCM